MKGVRLLTGNAAFKIQREMEIMNQAFQANQAISQLQIRMNKCK